ncbi:MAG: hypothetical protein EOO93_29275, partial [Pedobacter sp.]
MNQSNKKILGFIIPNLIILSIIGNNKMLNPSSGGVLVFSEFVILPMLMGIMSAWFWKDYKLSNKTLIWNSILNGFIAILLSYFFLGEGTICLIIVSPLIFAFVVTGAFIGKVMFKRRDQKMNISFVSLLL